MSPRQGLRVALVVTLLSLAACGGNEAGQGASGAPEQQEEGGEGHGQGGKKGGGENSKDEKKDKPAQASPSPTRVIRVRVTGGEVSGVESTVAIPLGSEVTIVVRSDEADEVHVHGYDVFDDVGPGEPAEIDLTADIPGEFEVELEHTHRPLFSLQVQ